MNYSICLLFFFVGSFLLLNIFLLIICFLFFLLFFVYLGVNLTEFDIDTVTSSSTHHNHNVTKQLHETIPSEVDGSEIDELVKPSKIHVQPLHAQDLLYESMKFEPDAGEINIWISKLIVSFAKCPCFFTRNIWILWAWWSIWIGIVPTHTHI